jgi:3-isopropylmalate/(R)-2-methylmalate dehydratase small subunit
MIPVRRIEGAAVVLDHPDLDTSRILPPGGGLFAGVGAGPAGPLRAAGNPPFLLAGSRFGAGADAGAAVRALWAAGVRCVIARGFGGMFVIDATHHGLPALALLGPAFDRLAADAATGAPLVLDLDRGRLGCADLSYVFTLDPFRRAELLDGQDELALTRDSATQDAIDRFEGADARRRPWAIPRNF